MKGKQVYQEGFTTGQTEWPLSQDANAKRFLQDGRYNLQVLAANSGMSACPSRPPEFTDMVLEFSARLEDGPETNAFGLVFRQLDSTNYYRLLISPARGWEFGRWVNRTWQAVAPLSTSPAIPRGRQAMTVRIVAKVNMFSFSVDGVELGTATDLSLSGGGICLFVLTQGDGGGRFSFDDLTVWDLAR